MTEMNKKRLAEATRAAYRKSRALRARNLTDLPAPTFDDGTIAYEPDKTLNKDIIQAGNGLAVIIPRWPAFDDVPEGSSERVYLEWATEEQSGDEEWPVVDELEIFAPEEPNTFPVRLVVPHDELQPDGPRFLRYRVQNWFDWPTTSEQVSLICDATPPWGNTEPPKPLLPEAPITDEYLEANPAGVVITVPDYPGSQKPGEWVAVWWGKEPLPNDPTDLPPAVYIEVPEPQEVTIPTSLVRSTGDGGCYAIYALFDRATNRSRLSVYSKAVVALGPLPGALHNPVVPLAGDGLLDLEDAFAGVSVEIPEFDNWKATDRIEVAWGTVVLEEEQIGSVPSFPFPVRVPEAVLKAQYGGAQGSVTTNVSYKVRRGGMEFGPMETDIEVDFSVIGPELPDWPNPTNPDLTPAEVYGEVSNTLNTLTAADNGKDAKLSFVLYSPLNADEVVEFYWANRPVEEARYTVAEGDQPGDARDVVIPWSYIEAEGNNQTLPVHYCISKPGAPNGQNSSPTYVDVSAVVITPEAPVFLNTFEQGDIVGLNCGSLDFEGPEPSVLVQVPALSDYLADGDEVVVHFTPLTGLSGETPLEDAIKQETITLGGETPVSGFIWRVEYEAHLLPIYDPGGTGRNGRARINYSFVKDGGPITSETTEVIVAMYDAITSCPIDAAMAEE